MSLLGPRPVVLSEGDLIFRRALAGAYRVRPGLSGLAQVRGRDLLTNEEKATLDGRYAMHLSFFQDALLFFSTLFAVLFCRHIREGGGGEPL
jgi:O-antigen biosynthesis protein WbqP